MTPKCMTQRYCSADKGQTYSRRFVHALRRSGDCEFVSLGTTARLPKTTGVQVEQATTFAADPPVIAARQSLSAATIEVRQAADCKDRVKRKLKSDEQKSGAPPEPHR